MSKLRNDCFEAMKGNTEALKRVEAATGKNNLQLADLWRISKAEFEKMSEVDKEQDFKSANAELKKYTSQEKYDKANTVTFVIKLNTKTDADILAAIDPKNKQGSIKRLIRKGLSK